MGPLWFVCFFWAGVLEGLGLGFRVRVKDLGFRVKPIPLVL